MTPETYEEQAANCDGLCVPDPDKIIKDRLPCVTCPFCKEIVTAELTPTTISCPECRACVQR